MIGRLLCVFGLHGWVTVKHHTDNVHGQRCTRDGCMASRWRAGAAAAKGCADCYRARARKVAKASRKLDRSSARAAGQHGGARQH